MKVPQWYKNFSLFWNTLALGMIFWIPNLIWWTELEEVLKQSTYTAAVVVMLIVFATWLPPAYRIFRDNSAEGEDLLDLAVFLVAFVFLQSSVIRALNYHLDRPDWIYHSPIGAFISYQIAILGVLISVAIFKTGGQYLSILKRRAGFALFVSGLLVGLIIANILRFG